MSNKFEISWPRIVAEGMAIVVSILLAFWIQAWWENRQAHADERIMLTVLSVELKEFTENYDGGLQYVNALRNSGRELMIATGNPNNPLSDEEVDSLLANLTWYVQPYGIMTPELDALISSGDMSVISNFSLRRRLAVLPAYLNQIRRGFEKSYDFFNGEFMPYLARNTSLPQIFDVSLSQPGNPNPQYPGDFKYERNSKQSHKSLLENKEFRNMLTIRLGNYDEIIDFNSIGIRERITESVELIDRELAEKYGLTDRP